MSRALALATVVLTLYAALSVSGTVPSLVHTLINSLAH